MSRIIFLVGGVLLFVAGCRTPQAGSVFPSAVRENQRQNALITSAMDEITQRTVALKASAASDSAIETVPEMEAAPIKNVAFKQRAADDSLPPVASVLAPSLVVPPASTSFSLDECESIALQNNPALAEASARVSAANGNWQQVGLRPNPVIGYSGQQLGSGGAANQNGGYIAQEFVRGNKLGLNREVAAWRVQKAEQQLAASRQRVITDVRIGYYDVLIAQRRRDLSQNLVRISVEGQTAAESLFKAEEVSEADPLRARVETETAKILLQTATNQYAAAWRRLAAVMGTPEMSPQPLTGELNAEHLTLTWQDTLQRILSESPEIGAANAEVEAARWAIQRACAEVVPNLEVQAVIQDDRGTGSTNANVQVTFPLPLWNRNQGGIQQARGEAAAAERAVNRLAMDLQTRLATAFQKFESAKNQVEQYSQEGGILDSTERSLTLVRKGYQVDEFGVLDLLSAQRTYFQTNLTYLDAQQELWTSATEIQGLLLRDSLSK